MTKEQLAEQYVNGKALRTTNIDNIRFAAFLAGHEAANQWIDVKDRFPENNDDVLVSVSKFGDVNQVTYCQIGGWENNEWLNDYGKPIDKNADHFKVTHWMPLPSKPTQNDL